MEIYEKLYFYYECKAVVKLKEEGISDPKREQIYAYIIKFCLYDLLLTK